MPASPFSRSLLFVVATVVVLLAVGERAWVTEDAYITFRTVDNFVHGYGLTWNIDERVQVYTHPLWMFLHIPLYWATEEPFLSTLALSVLCSVGAFVVAARQTTRDWMPAVLALALVLSRAFCDYATSGLENPLNYLLLALFVTGGSLRRQAFLVALLGFNRLDMLAIVGLALAYQAWGELRSRRLGAVGDLGLGFLPLILWELFSLFYYGFPYPNTRYAKLSTGVDRWDYIDQGFAYLFDFLVRDPVGAGLIVLGVLAGLVAGRQERRAGLLAVGVVLYVVYVINVGGDFMTGRFFAVPIFLSAVLLVRFLDQRPASAEDAWAVGVALAVVVGVWPRGTTFSFMESASRAGIADERAHWAPTNSLIAYKRGKGSVIENRLAQEGLKDRAAAAEANAAGERYVTEANTIGMRGFFAGPDVILLDHNALSDPLLARLPLDDPRRWRPGHFTRNFPKGYEDARRQDDPSLMPAPLQAYYTKLRLVVAGDLWDGERLAAIIGFNLGQYDELLAPWIEARQKAAEGREEPQPNLPFFDSPALDTGVERPKKQGRPVALADVQTPINPHTRWDEAGNSVLPVDTEVRFTSDVVLTATELEVSANARNRYTFVFYHRDQEVGRFVLTAVPERYFGLAVRQVTLPEGLAGAPFDAVGIWGEGNGEYAVGHLIFR